MGKCSGMYLGHAVFDPIAVWSKLGRDMARATNLALMRLRRRAEAADPAMLVGTFVDTGTLLASLGSPDHQILSGRRGTGKTHALAYLEAYVRERGDLPIVADMRTIGSTGGIYADNSLSISERGTRLLCDTLARVHDGITDYALELSYQGGIDTTRTFQLLDRLGEAITEVVVVGEREEEHRRSDTTKTSTSAKLDVSLSPSPRVGVSAGGDSGEDATSEMRLRETGVGSHRVQFGNVAQTLALLLDALPVSRIWILLDEWSEVPMELQPLLADLINRALLPVRGVTVKIGAIGQRSNFWVATDSGGYLGIEVGAATTDDLDLDDYMVFGNDATKAKAFFRELLYRHVRAVAEEEGRLDSIPSSAAEFQRQAFTQHNAFDEFVRAAEGVPRDGLNVILVAARRADDDPIGVDHVRGAAREWYVRNKEKSVSANPGAKALLHWIIDKVIGERRARAFLLEQGEAAMHPLIGALYDARVLHIIKRGVSTHDRPGVRFDVYALDYGCYVELMTTANPPLGLFEVEATEGQDTFVQVPTDDYRSIRRAILDLDEFERDYASRLGPVTPTAADAHVAVEGPAELAPRGD
jgi:hypothetical protein